MGAEIVLQVLWVTILVIYYQLEALVRFFIQKGRKDVRGEIVLVTGAGSGIGQRLAIEFAKLGCTIVGWDISKENLEETEAIMMKETGKKLIYYTCDLSDRNKVYKTAEQTKDEVGSVNILINNAGIVTGKKILECPDSLMQKTMEVNAMSHFWTIKSFLPEMLSKNHGHVVTIASAAGFFGVPGQVDYAASKFAAVGLSEALFNELHHIHKTGVKVTCICPYYINTGMFDGVKCKMIPIVEKNHAVNSMVDAILREKFMVFLPKIVNILTGMKNLLCTKSLLAVAKHTGVHASMDDFVGRNKN